MAKLVISGLVLALLLAPGAALAKRDAQGNRIKPGPNACKPEKYERCLNKCIAAGGKGRASHHKGLGGQECPWHCQAKKKC